eukprot:5451049-Pleurochrysis_carterae.AAC.1
MSAASSERASNRFWRAAIQRSSSTFDTRSSPHSHVLSTWPRITGAIVLTTLMTFDATLCS